MVRIRPERFPKHSFKKLFARACGPYRILKRLGSNAYLIDLPPDLSISPIFNVEDLTLHRGTFEPPTFSASVTGGSATSSVSVPKLPPVPPAAIDDVEAILEDEIVSTATGGFQRFLVRWKGRPQSDNSWVREEDLRRMAPALLDDYLHDNSPGASFSKPGRYDGITKTYFRKKFRKNT